MPPLTRRPEWTARQDHYRKIQDVNAFIPGMLLADRVCPESAGTE
jgi:hypothetical protein